MERSGRIPFYIEIGYKLFQRDRPAEAWPWLERSLSMGRPSTDDYLLGAMCRYHGLGQFREAVALLEGANERGTARAKRLGLAKTPFRVLDSVWARHIGHIAEIDYVIKLGLLEGRRHGDTILYLPPGSPVANRFLLQQVAAGLRLVENPADLPFAASAVQPLHYDLRGPRLSDGTTAYFWEIAGKTHKRWDEEKRAPLFSLPRETNSRGWATLHKMGVPQDAWFVTLHVREGTWDGRGGGIHGIRNADVSTYFPAITEITRRGGWVVRIGDPSMTPLPILPKVLDYSHSDERADWMDIFTLACCRFMIGTNSGPAFVPPLYGTPCVLTNWWPPAERPWHASDIFIPKMHRRLSDGSYLTLRESLCEPFSFCHSRRYLADHEGVVVEDNDPELIRAAVVEMLARLDGVSENRAEVSAARLQANHIYEAQGAVGMGELASDFLRRHGDLIR